MPTVAQDPDVVLEDTAHNTQMVSDEEPYYFILNHTEGQWQFLYENDQGRWILGRLEMDASPDRAEEWAAEMREKYMV